MQRTFKELAKEQVPPQVIITAAFVVMLTIGYGVWSEETSGNITIASTLYGTEVFVDNGRAGIIKTAGEKETYQYPAGKHTVVVARGGYWPWKKDLNITPKQTVVLNPFLIRQEIKPEVIPQFSVADGVATESEEYLNTLALFDNISIPVDIVPIISSISLKNVRAADYYPGRKDVLLVAVQNGIFAIDAIQNDPRNFQPIYEGTSPLFVKTANNVIFIKDGNSLFRVSEIN
ncbi:MAG: PEGA domain-containing protein [Candidatus Parcubacteria bacterium]|nr:PEGA domain-containing protein [Candidatus Parcubacteria bacterium]